jgi:hypothetical protein
MDLAPFMTTAVHTCPRCYRTSMVAHRVRYCERLCLPAVGGFVNGTHVGSTPEPHLHGASSNGSWSAPVFDLLRPAVAKNVPDAGAARALS